MGCVLGAKGPRRTYRYACGLFAPRFSPLAFSLGLTPKLDHEDPTIRKIYEHLIAECGKRGIYAGIHCGSPDYAARMIQMGFRLTTIANDAGLMAKASLEAVAGVWKVVGDKR